MAAVPIWKDHYVNLGGGDGVQFRIKVGDTIIYTGKSYPRPGETTNNIRINDICADYLQNVLPTLSQAVFSAMTLPVSFDVEVYITGEADWDNVETVQFLYDWSYDSSYDASTMGMAFPVNGKVDPRQWIIHTVYNAEQVTATLTFKDGTTSSVIIAISRSNDFNDDFNIDFSRSTAAAGSGSAVFDLSQWSNLAKVTIGNATYTIVDRCHQYALHYINAFGGWDSLLIEGNDLKEDTLTRYTREMEYDNRSTMNRGVKNYVNEIDRKITLHSGWLSDDESLRMHHLMNSTEVYLEDITGGKFYPVTITNTSLQYKTYKNNGGSLVNYEIVVSLAQNRIRR